MFFMSSATRDITNYALEIPFSEKLWVLRSSGSNFSLLCSTVSFLNIAYTIVTEAKVFHCDVLLPWLILSHFSLCEDSLSPIVSNNDKERTQNMKHNSRGQTTDNFNMNFSLKAFLCCEQIVHFTTGYISINIFRIWIIKISVNILQKMRNEIVKMRSLQVLMKIVLNLFHSTEWWWFVWSVAHLWNVCPKLFIRWVLSVKGSKFMPSMIKWY